MSQAGANRFAIIWTRVGLIALVLILMALPVLAPHIVLIDTTDVLIFVLLALSLNLLVGYAGMLSLGHAAFFASGGYCAGILVKHLGVSMPLAFVASPLLAALASLIIGFFSVRLSHAYFIMLTLAFGQLLFTVVWKWRDLTGGDDGLTGIMPAPVLAGPWAYYYFALGVVLVCAIILYRIGQSPFGRALKAIKDNPRRADFVGINVRRYQLASFVLAGAFAGVAGALQVFFHRGIFPGSAHWITSADAFVAVVLGGAGYFTGPIIGTVVFKALGFAIPRITEYWLFFLGAAIMVVALVRPKGLMSLWHSWRAKSA
jgi:branched-chain amino acid transport system permease protein